MTDGSVQGDARSRPGALARITNDGDDGDDGDDAGDATGRDNIRTRGNTIPNTA
jgi:hypothetical protein